MVPSGTLYTVACSGKAGGYLSSTTPGDVENAIAGALQVAGFAVKVVTVKDTDVLPGIVSFSWAGSITVRTTFDYTTDDDVSYQLLQAVEAATGYPATLSNPTAGDPSVPDPQSPWEAFLAALQKDAGIALVVVVGVVVLVVVVGGEGFLTKVAAR